MTKNEIITLRSKYLEIIDVGNSLFNKQDYPEWVFRNHNWKVFLLESWNIFDENSFNDFKAFCIDLNESELYLCAIYLLDFKFEEYEKTINERNKSYYPLVRFNTNMSFESFDYIQEAYHFNSATDSLIFSNSGLWCLYVNTDIDLMILGYSDDIKHIATKHYLNNNERIKSIEYLNNDLNTWAKEENIEYFKEKILQNYKIHF